MPVSGVRIYERIRKLNISKITWELGDNRGRRSGIDRRYFSYSDHIPERRRKQERRSLEDRRAGFERRDTEDGLINTLEEQRLGIDRRAEWN